MSEIIWISEQAARAIHHQQLALFGGAEGILDPGKLSSALARPRHLHTYNPDVSLYQLAAAYCWGLAKHHPFVDGNKRTAFVVMATFLQVNSIELIAPEAEVVATMLAVAAGEMSEEELGAWLQGIN
ncbi:MAG: type II toxin-antitoxin system death-on-curing family toxin [Microcystis panniformis]